MRRRGSSTHEPAAFCAALLNAQPMGFWSPHTLVRDARRHGVVVHTPDLNASWPGRRWSRVTSTSCDARTAVSPGGVAVRLGLGSVRRIWSDLADEIEAERKRVVRSADTEDLVRRVPSLTLGNLEAMATAGVFERVLRARPSRGVVDRRSHRCSRGRDDWRASSPVTRPASAGMTPVEEAVADLWATGVSPDGHPTSSSVRRLTRSGCSPRAQLWDPEPARSCVLPVWSPIVSGRMTAQGVTFLNLEDETGLINVVVSKGCWAALP